MNKDKLLQIMQQGEIKFSPSQNAISFPIVERIYKKMKANLKFGSIQIAKNSIIVNGHHRYLAALLAGVELEMVESPLTSAKTVNQWKSVELVDEDWDTFDKIKMLNRKDALYNEMTLDQLLELIT